MKNIHKRIKQHLCKHRYSDSIQETPYAYEIHKVCLKCGKEKSVKSIEKRRKWE